MSQSSETEKTNRKRGVNATDVLEILTLPEGLSKLRLRIAPHRPPKSDEECKPKRQGYQFLADPPLVPHLTQPQVAIWASDHLRPLHSGPGLCEHTARHSKKTSPQALTLDFSAGALRDRCVCSRPAQKLAGRPFRLAGRRGVGPRPGPGRAARQNTPHQELDRADSSGRNSNLTPADGAGSLTRAVSMCAPDPGGRINRFPRRVGKYVFFKTTAVFSE